MNIFILYLFLFFLPLFSLKSLKKISSCQNSGITSGNYSKSFKNTNDIFETGKGYREHNYFISFPFSFCRAPTVQISVNGFEFKENTQIILSVHSTFIYNFGFWLKIETGEDAKVYLVRINWTAIQI